jgi:hypothetical protein
LGVLSTKYLAVLNLIIVRRLRGHDVPAKLLALLRRLWQKDPTARPDLDEVQRELEALGDDEDWCGP